MTQPNIFYIQPYALDFHYGKELNKHIELMPDDAWIVVTDTDTLWLTPNHGRIIHNAIVTYPDTAIFTCWTNRLGQYKRCYGGKISENPDIKHHANIAKYLEREVGHKCTIDDGHLAGFFWCFPKSTWLANPFDELPIISNENHRIKSFDVRWTERIKGIKRRIEGLYIFHVYRLMTSKDDITHLSEQDI